MFAIVHSMLKSRANSSRGPVPPETSARGVRTSAHHVDRAKATLFMHVPKCGGVSLTNSLIEALRPLSRLEGFDRSLFGDYQDFESFQSENRPNIYMDVLPEGDFDFIAGHMALSTLKARFPEGRYMIVLREPRVRLVSLFLYWRSLPETELARFGSWSSLLRLSQSGLFDFLVAKKLACQTDNLFARLLLRPHAAIPDGDFTPSSERHALYEEAKRKIDEFDFVDLLENPKLEGNISFSLTRPFRLCRDNETPVRSDLPIDIEKELSEDVRNRLESLTEIDRQLWAHVAQRQDLLNDKSPSADHRFAAYVKRAQQAWGAVVEERALREP